MARSLVLAQFSSSRERIGPSIWAPDDEISRVSCQEAHEIYREVALPHASGYTFTLLLLIFVMDLEDTIDRVKVLITL